jgi:hypothetical protein
MKNKYILYTQFELFEELLDIFEKMKLNALLVLF